MKKGGSGWLGTKPATAKNVADLRNIGAQEAGTIIIYLVSKVLLLGVEQAFKFSDAIPMVFI
jgi:hypothetical protein